MLRVISCAIFIVLACARCSSTQELNVNTLTNITPNKTQDPQDDFSVLTKPSPYHIEIMPYHCDKVDREDRLNQPSMIMGFSYKPAREIGPIIPFVESNCSW